MSDKSDRRDAKVQSAINEAIYSFRVPKRIAPVRKEYYKAGAWAMAQHILKNLPPNQQL